MAALQSENKVSGISQLAKVLNSSLLSRIGDVTIFMMTTKTVSDYGFMRCDYDLSWRTDIQWNNEDNSKAEKMD
jgi:hypothetical protein